MGIPYVGFSNTTLRDQPDLKHDDTITCPRCSKKHFVVASKKSLILTYQCNGKSYLAGIGGKSILGVKNDIGGEI